MNRGKRAVLVTVGLAMMLLIGGCKKEEQKTEQVTNLPQIIIGSDNYPPYAYMDTDGEVIGIDVDLAREAFQRMGYEAKIVMINWESKKELIQNGEIDCIWCCFSMDGREDDYQWAGPYMISKQVVAVEPDSEIYTLQDLEGKSVAVQSTTKPEDLFLKKTPNDLPQIHDLISVKNRELIYSFLSKGYVDAIAAHETAILQYMSDYKLEYRILAEPLLTVGLGVAFDKNDDRGLSQKLDETLKKMREDGTEKKIIGKYLDNPEKYMEVDADEK